jgi:hypothetical protein
MAQPYDLTATYDWFGSYDSGPSVAVAKPSHITTVRARYTRPVAAQNELRSLWVEPIAQALETHFGGRSRVSTYDWASPYDANFSYDGFASSGIRAEKLSFRAAWGVAHPTSRLSRFPFAAAAPEKLDAIFRWNGTSPFERTTRISVRSAAIYAAAIVRLRWRGTDALEYETHLRWGSAPAHQDLVRMQWPGTAQHNPFTRLRWLRGRPYRTGYTIPLPGDPSLPPGSTIEIPSLEVYYMTPSLTMVRTSDGADIKPIDCSIKLDNTSLAWTLDATIPRQTLPLVDPNANDDPVLVQVSINGYVGNFIIESYTDNRKFGGTGAKITGRTRHALLGAPYAPLVTFTNTEGKDASQLATDLCPDGWTMVWSAPDWLVPAGLFTYADQSPIQSIAQLAAAIGATILPDIEEQTITVLPTYQVSPWDWGTTTPYADIPAAFWTDLSGQWQGQFKNAYNGIFVTGQNSGVAGLIKRTGSDGAIQLPSVTDQLIVHVDAARERGRFELAKADARKTETIKVPLLPAPASDTNPGIFLPGQLVSVTEKNEARTADVAWKGMITSVQIDATHSSSAGSSMSVRQTLSIERHR